ncbi:unnamed protein product [Closterium sp. Yama58-4]|nr:unnamed protein product [Closterium sp. Yama58-4]
MTYTHGILTIQFAMVTQGRVRPPLLQLNKECSCTVTPTKLLQYGGSAAAAAMEYRVLQQLRTEAAAPKERPPEELPPWPAAARRGGDANLRHSAMVQGLLLHFAALLLSLMGATAADLDEQQQLLLDWWNGAALLKNFRHDRPRPAAARRGGEEATLTCGCPTSSTCTPTGRHTPYVGSNSEGGAATGEAARGRQRRSGGMAFAAAASARSYTRCLLSSSRRLSSSSKSWWECRSTSVAATGAFDAAANEITGPLLLSTAAQRLLPNDSCCTTSCQPLLPSD